MKRPIELLDLTLSNLMRSSTCTQMGYLCFEPYFFSHQLHYSGRPAGLCFYSIDSFVWHNIVSSWLLLIYCNTSNYTIDSKPIAYVYWDRYIYTRNLYSFVCFVVFMHFCYVPPFNVKGCEVQIVYIKGTGIWIYITPLTESPVYRLSYIWHKVMALFFSTQMCWLVVLHISHIHVQFVALLYFPQIHWRIASYTRR